MSWKEESLLAGEPWGAKRRDGAVSPGGAQQPGHREGAAQKALCTMREEKLTGKKDKKISWVLIVYTFREGVDAFASSVL